MRLSRSVTVMAASTAMASVAAGTVVLFSVNVVVPPEVVA
jgi:hypothetical protein